jgi:hypothetical protein
MLRRWPLAALLGLTACTPHPVGPARTDGSYLGKARTTAESALSAVETVRLAASAADDSFGPYLSILVSGQEEALSGTQGTFASIQSPSEQSDEVGDELTALLDTALDHIVAVRVATKRGDLHQLEDVAEPLQQDADALRHFIEDNGGDLG